jgi:hypothetical protein
LRINKQGHDISGNRRPITTRGIIKKNVVALISTVVMLLLAATLNFSNAPMASAAEQYELDYIWGSSGTGDGQLRRPLGGDFDSEGNFYVVDLNNNRIQKFTEDGIFLKAWGGLCDALANPDGCDGKFRFPRRLAVDSNDNVYVADTVNERIQVFDSEGTFLRKTNLRTILGTVTNQQPQGIDVDNTGNIYVTSNNNMLKLNNAGNAILDRATAPIADIGLDPQGNIIGLNGGGFGTLYKLNSDLDVVKSVSKADVQLKQPTALGVDSHGNVYVVDDINGTTDPTPDRIIKLTNDFEFVLKFADVGDSSATSTRVLQPGDVAVNADGKVFVSDVNWIKVYTPIETNLLPTANAGADRTVNEGDNVALDGSASSDSDGIIQSYSWIQITGTNVTIASPNTATPSFTAPNVKSDTETFTFELKVTDDGGATSADRVNIVVNNINQFPIAAAGEDFSVNEGTSGVQLDGTASSDTDGAIASYLWEQTGGPAVTLVNADTASPTFDAPSVSSNTALTFKLTVADNGGANAEDTIVVTVNNVNQPPTANAGDAQTVNEGDTVTLDGSRSIDTDGTIASYSWTQTTGTSVTLTDANSATPSFVAPDVDAGGDTLTFELTVTDNDGTSSTTADTVDVNVNNVVVNQPPTANAGNDQTVNEGDTISLDGSASTDPDGDTLTYSWTQTEGEPVSLNDARSATPSFTAPDVGADDDTLAFELTVDDGNGHTATDIVNIEVNDNPPPATEYSIRGFYAPVDMEDADGDSIVNIIKSGRSVALKFEVFDQNNAEQTSTDIIESSRQNRIDCSTLQGDPTDAIETTNTGGTTLRYDTNGGTFIQNWKTPSGQAGSCYSTTVTTVDGSSSITAYFRLS